MTVRPITISDLSKLCTFLTEGAHNMNFIITHFCSMIETYNRAHIDHEISNFHKI